MNGFQDVFLAGPPFPGPGGHSFQFAAPSALVPGGGGPRRLQRLPNRSAVHDGERPVRDRRRHGHRGHGLCGGVRYVDLRPRPVGADVRGGAARRGTGRAGRDRCGGLEPPDRWTVAGKSRRRHLDHPGRRRQPQPAARGHRRRVCGAARRLQPDHRRRRCPGQRPGRGRRCPHGCPRGRTVARSAGPGRGRLLHLHAGGWLHGQRHVQLPRPRRPPRSQQRCHGDGLRPGGLGLPAGHASRRAPGPRMRARSATSWATPSGRTAG